METLGLNLNESKALLAGVQDFVVAQQVHDDLERRRVCPHCHRRYTSKDSGNTPVSTVFGRVQVPNPRWHRCACQTEGPKTFRPIRSWLLLVRLFQQDVARKPHTAEKKNLSQAALAPPDVWLRPGRWPRPRVEN